MEPYQKENIRILRERFDENQKDLVIPYPIELKEKIVRIAELCYRPNIQQIPPNFLFSIIKYILDGRSEDIDKWEEEQEQNEND